MTSSVRSIWALDNSEDLIVNIARVSSPKSQVSKAGDREGNKKLLKYLIDHKHWSPFEMVNACIEINTTRDVGRQILRHRSFSFQEFSQRYANVDTLSSQMSDHVGPPRLQDTKNRQSSIDVDPMSKICEEWENVQRRVVNTSLGLYEWALEEGIAKEVARKLLPEGLTPTRMYMNGTIRSWIHYIQLRTGPETQKEHREVALGCREVLKPILPTIFEVLDEDMGCVGK